MRVLRYVQIFAPSMVLCGRQLRLAGDPARETQMQSVNYLSISGFVHLPVTRLPAYVRIQTVPFVLRYVG